MPWQPLPHIAFAVATFPFAASHPEDLVLEIGDELYIIEETADGSWLRGYLLKPPSLLAGLTSVKGQTLEARVFSGIFPRNCVEVRELLGESEAGDEDEENARRTDVSDDEAGAEPSGALQTSGSVKSGSAGRQGDKRREPLNELAVNSTHAQAKTNRNSHRSSLVRSTAPLATRECLSVPVERIPNAPRPPAPVPMLKIGDETPTSASEPLIDEIASCLRQWHSTNLHELLLSRQYHKLEILSQLITSISLARQQLLHNVLTKWEYRKLREKTVWDLVRVDKLCGGEVIVRDPVQRGRTLTGDDSVIEITQLQSVMSTLNEAPHQTPEPAALHHLLVEVKGFVGASTEDTKLALSLVGRVGGNLVRLSEDCSISTPSGGSIVNIAKGPATRTLFTDLSSADIGESPALDSELFIVVAVRSNQKIPITALPIAGKPGSRSGTGSIGHSSGMSISAGSSGPKAGNRPPLSSGNKTVRRSLMWSSKNTRVTFSRGNDASKLDSLDELGEDRPGTSGAPPSRDDHSQPPSTANSRSAGRDSVDGVTGQHVTAERTIGVGVLKLNAIMKQQGDELEHVVNIWAPSDRIGVSTDKQNLGDNWEPLLQELMFSKSGQFEKSRGAERVQMSFRAFDHQDADVLIRDTPTLLSGISKTNRMGFPGAPTKPRSDIYVTLQAAMLSRQVLLSRYGTSPAALPSGIHGNNLQVTVEVRRANGERVDNCIHPYSNGEALSTWRSLASERREGWRQTLRLTLAPEDVSSAHVVFFVADMPNPPFAVAYVPLWDQAAFVRDGSHSLLLYRVDENTVAPQPPASSPPGRGGYLSLPWAIKGRGDAQTEVTGPLAALRIETYLCSTQFSQDRVVLGLLKWREGPKDDVPILLQQLIFVPEIEVVKLLSDVLDALFAILVDYAGNDEYEDLIFTALVRVLGIVYDRRFNVGPLVDQYAETKFNYPFATPCLVRSFARLLAKPTEPQIARKLRATFKVVRQILKFITHARDQQRVKEACIGITSTSPGFTRHLQSIFKSLEAMMRNTAPVLVGSQTLAVQHFHTWLPELANLLSTEEILHIAIDFMDACSNVKGKLILYKLVLIINYSRLDIFSHPEQRSALSANTARWIAPHWGHSDEVTEQWKEQVRLCCSILASQIDHLGPEIPDYVPKILESYLAIQSSLETITAKAGLSAVSTIGVKSAPTKLSLLFPTQYPFPSRPIVSPERGPKDLDGRIQTADQQNVQEPAFDEALVELSAILSALSNSPSGMQLELADGDIAVILENTLRVHMSILRGDAFPPTWLSMHIFYHKSIMQTLQYLAGILLDNFLPDPDDAESFNTELWKMFFTTLLMLVSSPSLALETFPEQKRRAVWKIAGDVREHGAELLRRTWEAIGWDATADEQQRYGLRKLGGYQVQYVPSLVGPIIELCLSVHEGLRRMAVEVLQTMIASEWTLSEDLSIIQAETIDFLDHYFKSKPLTESILQKLFVSELLDRFTALANTPGEPLYTALRELIATIDEFLDLLVAVHGSDGGGAVGSSVAAGTISGVGGVNGGSSAPGEASHLINRLRLMEFLRDMHKEEMFVRYVHQLASLQATLLNHTEAGLALRLHAELYEWDPLRMAPALLDPPFPAQSHFERKERIYFDIIKHFEEGEAWSSALAAYKELQVQYESNIYDFSKLARTERAIATVYETIAKSDRLVPKYFRVMFRGLGFPASVRDKEYVYEGSPHERTSAFTDRMQEQYPAAQIVIMPAASGGSGPRIGSGLGAGAGKTATEDMIDDIVEGQFLVVSATSPHRDLRHQVFQRARVSQVVRDYLVSSHPQVFATSLRRQTNGPVTEHYVEKTTYTTAESFPTILRRSEIVSVGEIRLSAKEAALERILRKTAEMTIVEKRVAEGDSSPETAQLLLDAISVSVNPSSESSVVSYRELIPTSRRRSDGNAGKESEEVGELEESDGEEDDNDDVPELDAQENAIKMALVDHAMMIKRSLALLFRSNNESLSGHAEDLSQYFEATFAPEIAIFTPQPLPGNPTPPPAWPRLSSTETTAPKLPVANFALDGAPNGANKAGNSDAVVQEASAIQPVAALRQVRGTRLSFLGGANANGKRDSIQLSNSEGTIPQSRKSSVSATGGDSVSEHSRSRSKDNNNRRSFFRANGEKVPPIPQSSGPEPTIVGSNTANGARQANDSDSSTVNSHFTPNNTSNLAGAGIANGKSKSGAGEWAAELTSRKSSDLGSMDRKKSTSHAGGAGDGDSNSHADVDSGGVVKMGSVRKRLSMLKLGKKSSKGSGLMVALDEE